MASERDNLCMCIGVGGGSSKSFDLSKIREKSLKIWAKMAPNSV